MGLIPGGLKRWLIRREAESAGRELAKRGGPLLDFLKRHKAKAGAIAAGIAAWCAAGCGEIPVATVFAWIGFPITGTAVVSPLDLIRKIPWFASASCGHVTFAMGIAGAFLVGAGISTSDKHEAVIQGLKPPAGPPDPKPEDAKG